MKLAAISPSRCSSCHGQYPERQHVDFDAYWDGPVIDENNGMKQAIDDLIICEDCLKAAATLIGMVEDKQMVKENYELGKAVEKKQETIDQQNIMIANLEHTLEKAMKNEDIKQPQGRRPAIQVPEGARI